MKTGQLVEAIMHYRHVGIEELSHSTGIATSNISGLLSSRRGITPSLAKKIGNILGVDPLVIMTNRMCEELKDK